MRIYILQLIAFSFFIAQSSAISAQATRATFGFSYLKKKDYTEKYIEIQEIIDKGDAKIKGLKSGDLIEELDGQKMESLSDYKITDIIVAAKQKKKLSVKRKGEKNPIELTLKEIATYVCLSKNCKEGKVKIFDVFNFYEYEGDYKNGNSNGQGVLTFKGVSTKYPAYHIIKQSGTYTNGYFVTGITEYVHGKFEGKAYNGVPQDEGIYTDNNGTIYKGKFDNGIISDGVIISKDSKGNTKETKVVNGKQL